MRLIDRLVARVSGYNVSSLCKQTRSDNCRWYIVVFHRLKHNNIKSTQLGAYYLNGRKAERNKNEICVYIHISKIIKIVGERNVKIAVL